MINDREIESEAVVSARLRKNRGRKPWKDGKPVILSYVYSLDSISLSWKGASITTEYKIKRDGILLDTVTDLTYTDSGLEPNQSYLYEIIATYRNIYFSPGVTITARTMVLPIPQWLEPIITTTSITLSWQSLGSEFLYVLFKNGVEVTRIPDLVYTFTELMSSTEYSFEIRSIQSCNCTIAQSQGNVVSLTTLVAPAPSGITIKPVGKDALLVFWDPVPGAYSYILERDDDQIWSGSELAFSDEGLFPDTTYSYKVKSVGGTSSSAPTLPLTAKTNKQLMVLDWSDKSDEYVIGLYLWITGYVKGYLNTLRFTESQSVYSQPVDVNSQQGFTFFGGGSRWRVDKIQTAPRWQGFSALAAAQPNLKEIIYQSHGSTTVHYINSVGKKRFTLKSIRFQPGLHICSIRLGPVVPEGEVARPQWTSPIVNPLSPPTDPFVPGVAFENIIGFALVRTNVTRLPGVTNDQGWPMGYGDIEIEWL